MASRCRAIASDSGAFGRGLPLAALAASLVSQNLGAAVAKGLFPVVGVAGMAALRIGLSALLLLAFWRPWRVPVARRDVANLLTYGAMLGGMNLCIYHAFARIPIGIATAIETTGPLLVVLAASRRALDVAWVALALAGLGLLLPLAADRALDPVGLLFAFGAAASWALYIVFGKRVSQRAPGQAVSLGMLVAAAFALPLGVAQAGAAMLVPTTLLAGLGVALLSSAIPYSLEMAALRRMPRHVFGIPGQRDAGGGGRLRRAGAGRAAGRPAVARHRLHHRRLRRRRHWRARGSRPLTASDCGHSLVVFGDMLPIDRAGDGT